MLSFRLRTSSGSKKKTAGENVWIEVTVAAKAGYFIMGSFLGWSSALIGVFVHVLVAFLFSSADVV